VVRRVSRVRQVCLLSLTIRVCRRLVQVLLA
jgi:hypothetical protein